MPLNLKNLQDHIADIIDVDDEDTMASVRAYINMAARDIWMAYPWHERRDEGTLTTVAPYSTGTVSSSSATITGSGTTFPAATAANLARFAKSYSEPWYVVQSRDSATQLTLTESYVDTALSASAYTLYQDTFELAAAVDTIIDVRLLKGMDSGPLAGMLERRLDEMAYIPGQAGTPEAWALVAPNATTLSKRVRLWPVPDAVYRLKYRYLKAYQDMATDGDECMVPESRRDLLLTGTLRWAWRLKEEDDKADAAEVRFQQLLKIHWQREKAQSPLPARIGRYDSVGLHRQACFGASDLTVPS
jgi:hypothetical protein